MCLISVILIFDYRIWISNSDDTLLTHAACVKSTSMRARPTHQFVSPGIGALNAQNVDFAACARHLGGMTRQPEVMLRVHEICHQRSCVIVPCHRIIGSNGDLDTAGSSRFRDRTQFSRANTCLHSRNALPRIDAYCFHPREVHHHTAFTDRCHDATISR